MNTLSAVLFLKTSIFVVFDSCELKNQFMICVFLLGQLRENWRLCVLSKYGAYFTFFFNERRRLLE